MNFYKSSMDIENVYSFLEDIIYYNIIKYDLLKLFESWTCMLIFPPIFSGLLFLNILFF